MRAIVNRVVITLTFFMDPLLTSRCEKEADCQMINSIKRRTVLRKGQKKVKLVI